MKIDWLIEYPLGFKGRSLLIEDDGDVCYAYIATQEGFIAHVWLYNRTEAPVEWPWLAKNFNPDVPQKNPVNFVSTSAFQLPISEEEFHIESSISANSVNGVVKVFLRKRLIACLNEDVGVGQSLLASKAGPLATPLLPQF